MSWSGSVSQPNWAGNDNADGEIAVGNLYIVPDPPTITENPSIGLEGRNEVPLPTKYLDLEVANLTATNIDAEDIVTTNLTADDITTGNLTATNITAGSINNNPNFDASNWSLYRAISDVRGTLGLFSVPQFSILDFLNITCTNAIQSTGGSVTAALSVVAGIDCAAPLGSFPNITSENIQVSAVNETAAVDIYGANLIAGNNALYVEGGTTLTGGGVIHGVTIGALQVAGADTNRIDVVPIGIDITTLATPIAITSGVACAVTAGAVLSLAGGSYIQYNSDQHYFINTTSGNDFTDIYVGNIHAADGGSAPLRINDAARGVELANVNSMTMTTQLAGVLEWSSLTTYTIGNKARIADIPATYYNAVLVNKDLIPNEPIPDWVTASNYVINNVVFSAGLVYRCSANISGSTTPPAPVSDPNWTNLGFTTNAITQFWSVFTPSVANITGDDVSNITIGKITAPVDFVRLAGDGLAGNTGLEGIGNIQSLALTTTLFPLWNVATDYGDNAEVSYGDGNWVSQFAGNLGNIPDATLQDWVSLGAYAVGNVRYYATDNNAYLCIAVVFGSATPPPSDPTKWSVFQVGNNGEDVFYPFTAPVVSTIVGDKLSEITIGNQSFVNGNGEYLSIRNAVAGDPLDADQNALIQSAGTLALAGAVNGVQVIATAGDITIGSLIGDVNISSVDQSISLGANVDVNIVATTGDVLIGTADTTGGNILITSNGTGGIVAQGNAGFESVTGDAIITSTEGNITLTSDLATTITSNSNAITLSSAEATSITSTANTVTITGSTGVSLTSPDAITLTSSTTDVIITSTLGDVDITAGNDVTISAGAAAVTILGATGVDITATANDINITSSAGVGITTVADGNITVNTYYPPLRIYKNETIGSAISRAANTAEIQVYQQTMTLKANTQYLLNVSYAGLTENVSTATPNNNWYYLYRIHQGTTPLSTANLWGLAQQFNSTAQAGGVSTSFMTTTAGTYTGRFYIRNQNATVALTVENISATVTEVF